MKMLKISMNMACGAVVSFRPVFRYGLYYMLLKFMLELVCTILPIRFQFISKKEAPIVVPGPRNLHKECVTLMGEGINTHKHRKECSNIDKKND